MKTDVNLRKFLLILGAGVVFCSCAKETDLVSEYLIRDAGQPESSVSSGVLEPGAIGEELISINEFPVWENLKDAEILAFTNQLQSF